MKIHILSAVAPALAYATITVASLTQSSAVHAQTTCSATSATLSGARSAYEQQCPSIPRVDCDPINGQWTCSSGVIGSRAPNGTTSSGGTDTGGTDTGGTDTGGTDTGGTDTGGGTTTTTNTFTAGNVTAARAGFVSQFGTNPLDCDPINGQWTCSSGVIGSRAPNGVTTSGSSGGGGSSSDGATVITSDIPSGSLYEPGDFIFLQYDSCPDPDDLHASVAGKMVVEKFGLQRGTDYGVVNGTCGEDRPRNDYIVGSPDVFTQLYGDEGSLNSWLDAYSKYEASTSMAAAKIQETLEAGQDVFIHDGGPHDFTSDVIRKLRSNGYTASLKGRVTNVQHSAGWNVGNTNDANMAYVRDQVTFLQIDNGNTRGNDTPQLNMWNTSNSGYDPVDANLVNQYRTNSVYGPDWQAAFAKFDPTNKFDGSDTVEILWTFNIKSNTVADWYDFATYFLPTATNTGGGTDTGGETPTGGPVLTFEAEDGANFSGTGWVTESSLSGASGGEYIVWRGSDKFRVTDSNPPAGIKSYDFVVTIPGVYKFEARVQSRIGNGGAASDADNDGWVKFTTGNDTNDHIGDATKWTKFFQASAPTSWGSYSNGEQYDPTFFTGIVRELAVGTHRVLVGGRSTRFGIDTVGLSLIRSTDGGGGSTTDPTDVVAGGGTDTGGTDTGGTDTGGGTTTTTTNTFTASNVTAARAGFIAQFGTAAVDCDPVNGQWVCSSDVIGNNAPGTTTSSGGTSSGGSGSLGLSGGLVSSVPGTNTTGTIVNRTDANVYTDGGTGRTPGGVSWHDSFSVNGKCYISTTFDHDAGNLTVNTPYGQKTVREIDSAQAANGRPNRGSNPIYNDVQCGNGPANNAGDEDIGQCPGRVDQGQAGCNRIGPMWELDELFQTNDNQPSITFQNGDFLSIHYDSSHDPDDLQAMIAAREILDTMPALQEGSDYITVNGTRKISHSTNISGSTNYMRTMFPSGLDASTAVGSGSFTTATVQQVATLWESTIRFGGTVFVAEGGPSDFSAAVVREILKRKNVVGIKNRIRIVQHSHGWNEDNTETEALSLLQNMVTYIQIDNGNGGGQTPDWNSGTGDAAFRARAVASQYGSQWVTAFDRIDDRVDFSDGVELFEIFGISPSEALTPAAFADKYF